MAGRYKPYPEYKNSGVEWLEDIPLHWNVRRTKAMFSLRRELVGKQSADYQLLSLTLRGVIKRDISDGGGKIPAEFDTYQRVCPQDLIFCLFDIDETPRTIGLSAHTGMITGAYSVYHCLGACAPEFAYYYFMHIDSFKGLKPFYTGLRKVVRSDTFSNIKMPAPGLAEQSLIANFLDHETAKIDTLIEKQQQLIQLLKEKRQAVISHAVTKGLNPNAKLRDSGVEWLGEVPEHWVVSNLAYVLKAIGDIDHYMPESIEKGTPYVMTGDLKELASSIDFEQCKQVSHNDYLRLSKKIRSAKGDVILARYATIGTASYIDVDADFLVSYSCVTIKPDPSKVYGIYLFNYFKSDSFLQGIQNQINTNTQGNVGVNDLKKLKIALPLLAEQSKIIEYLQTKITTLDSITNRAQAAITLMQERRTALISAAVTGKIDVRDWVAPQASTTHKEVAA